MKIEKNVCMTMLQSRDPGHNYAVLGEVRQSTSEEVKAAVCAAKKAFPAWRALTVEQRSAYFEKLIPIYEHRAEEIARMQTLETGKTISQSTKDVAGDVAGMKSNLSLAATYLKEEIVDDLPDQVSSVVFEPYGVMAAIMPWNYPTSNFFISVTQGLLVGNTVVAKHSEECPLTSTLLYQLFAEAGFPNGVINLLYGDGTVGRMLVEEDIDVLHFTGSSKVGRELYALAGAKFIPAVLEMGGSSPGIVFADADIDFATFSVCRERYRNCGQICCALKRLFVERTVYEKMVQKLIAHVATVKLGDPLESSTYIGPLVAERQLVLLEEQVADAVKKGAKVLCGGKRSAESGLNGAYYEPTVLTGITPEMRAWNEELFGPVLTIHPFHSEAEAIELANGTEYGLSAFVYTGDLKKARRVANMLEVGNVSINGASYFTDNAPFGGHKKSGLGSNNGKYGFYHVAHMKNIAIPRDV